uniref:Transposase n=1 Tax=Heterorhabditis bacteriophora TaxID=37862 RepID=A0A1I7XMJ3_HETBA
MHDQVLNKDPDGMRFFIHYRFCSIVFLSKEIRRHIEEEWIFLVDLVGIIFATICLSARKANIH